LGDEVLDVAAGRGALLSSGRKGRTDWPYYGYRLFSRHGARNS
jgi:hypothetical protein